LFQKFYRTTFWFGYTAVLVTSLIPITGNLTRVKVNLIAFEIHLDHLLHLSAYFLICMYYLAGQWKGLSLFNTNSLRKFLVVTVVLATVTEVVQLWVPARAFNVMDWVANVAGIVLGVVVIKIKDSRRKILRNDSYSEGRF
jgi:VanZ family protein